MAELSHFIAGADIGLGERAEVAPTRLFVAARLQALQDLAMPMRSLSLGATQRQMAQMAQRAQAVREQRSGPGPHGVHVLADAGVCLHRPAPGAATA